MTTREHDHGLFRRNLGDYLLDLLDEQDSAFIETHARDCGSCGKLLAAARRERTDWWEGTGHPPVSLLSAVQAGMASGERVRYHLNTCAECREDLAALSGAVVEPAPPPNITAVPAPYAERLPKRRRWVAMASVAAVLAVVLLARQQSGAPVAVIPPGESAGALIAPPPDAAPVEPAARGDMPPASDRGASMEPVAIADVTRGDASARTAVVIPAGVGELPLTLPALFLPEKVTVVVELHRGDGAVLSRQELTVARALATGGIRLNAARLASGPHVLRVAWFDADSGAQSREYPLDITTQR